MSGLVTFLVGSSAEAWSEFRTHKARVAMSLIGVGLAVLALTGVIGVGQVAQQSVTESLERDGGRPALLSISSPSSTSADGSGVYSGDYAAMVTEEMSRYGIRWWSPVGYEQATVALPQGATPVQVKTVAPAYATMHRTRVKEGSWFGAADAERLAPAIVVDEVFWKAIGSPPLATHPSVSIIAPGSTTATIIGVTPGGFPGSPSAFLLTESFAALQPPGAAPDPSIGYEAWVPPSSARALRTRLAADLDKRLGDGWTTYVSRSDYGAQGGDPLLILKVVVGGAAGVILTLALLGLLNISLVTVRTRIREIGIRRAFGATAGRVFFGVMMESVVATTVAGVIGVALAVFALKNPYVTGRLQELGLQDIPPFPFSAALIGLAISVGVGALAGLIPALIAVRVKPIDAIRY